MLRALCILLLLGLSVSLTTCQHREQEMHICFAGDMLLDRGARRVISVAGYDTLFSGVRNLFHAMDAVVVNLECPLTHSHTPLFKRFVFRSDPESIGAIQAAGITHLDVANNHSYDQGREGLRETRVIALSKGLSVVGMGNTHKQSCEPVIIQKQDQTVAVFASVLVPLENWVFNADSLSICQATASEIAANVRAYKAQHPSSHCVVLLHWGQEFVSEASIEQRAWSKEMVDAGAELIVGHHPHVVQGPDTLAGTMVMYSLGNFIFDQSREVCNQAQILELIVRNDKLSYVLHPIHIDNCIPTLVK